MRKDHPRPLAVCQHEAAHVVVGIALGLRLKEVVVRAERGLLGWTTFNGCAWRDRESFALVYAAGVVWDRSTGNPLDLGGDMSLLRDVIPNAPGRRSIIVAARAILESRMPAHKRVTAALLERDLVHADIARIARGERP